MEKGTKEKYIPTTPEPVSLRGTENILFQMNNCVCRIYNSCKGTGFFTKIPFKSRILPVLITNNHILGENDIKNGSLITLYLNNDKNIKVFEIDKNRLRYTNKALDITIIEIKENIDNLSNNYLDLDDKIISYLESSNYIKSNYFNKIYSSESLYVINYPEDKEVVVSYGPPPQLNEYEIHHKCCTKPGSSGSPILLINNQKLIGIHSSSSKNFEYNFGSLLIHSIKEFENKNKAHIYNDEYIINGKNETNNYILAEFDIQEDNQNARIINSYEQTYKSHPWWNYAKFLEDEKEIKENIEISINDNIIKFSYFYKFNKKGKYYIKYKCKKNLTKLCFLFEGCSSLTNVDFSNFNSNEVINMDGLFGECRSLSKVNFSNFNSNNVINMDNMFFKCSSLKYINLSNFNTNKLIKMRLMFFGCSSLTSLNLSNFNTNNVFDMSSMFYNCSSLTYLNLSNFNTNNVINMNEMFTGCKNLDKNKIVVNDKKLLNYLNICNF